MRPLSTLAITFALTRVAHGLSSSLTRVNAFVSTSQDVSMYIYVPNVEPATNIQAIIVAIHSCERTAEYYYENTGYAALADQYGYLVIYPNASVPSGCWDTTSKASLTRNGGGDSQAIANMVNYAVKNLNGDANRVATTGSSSGGIMVNLLAGIYPDVFQAASVFSGEYANSIWPYSGSRPKMKLYHGTADATYPYTNLGEELAGWSQALGVTFSNNITDTPSPGYTEMVYGDGSKLVGVSAAGVGHTVPVDAAADLAWFCISPTCDLDGLSAVSTTSSTSSTASSTITTSTSLSAASTSSTTTSTSSSSTIGDATNTSTASATFTSENSKLASETSASSTPLASQSTAAHSALSSGAKAGISAGVIALALLFFAAGVFLIRKRQQKRNRPEPEIGHPRFSLDQEGHEYSSGYGIVPVNDAKQTEYNTEKHQAQKDPEATPATELLGQMSGAYHSDSTSRTSGVFHRDIKPPYMSEANYRDSTASTLLEPHSPGLDPRYSATSATMLLPHPARAHQRNSSLSTLLPHSSQGEEQDISDVPFKP